MHNRFHSPLLLLRWIVSNTKRLAVFVVGTTLVGAGFAMLILPGPGILVSIAGLALLSTQFAWAERALDRSKVRAIDAANQVAGSIARRIALGASAIGLIIGGAIAAALSREYRVLGISVLVAGISTLSILLPQTRRWLHRRVSNTPSMVDPTTQAPGKVNLS